MTQLFHGLARFFPTPFHPLFLSLPNNNFFFGNLFIGPMVNPRSSTLIAKGQSFQVTEVTLVRWHLGFRNHWWLYAFRFGELVVMVTINLLHPSSSFLLHWLILFEADGDNQALDRSIGCQLGVRFVVHITAEWKHPWELSFVVEPDGIKSKQKKRKKETEREEEEKRGGRE